MPQRPIDERENRINALLNQIRSEWHGKTTRKQVFQFFWQWPGLRRTTINSYLQTLEDAGQIKINGDTIRIVTPKKEKKKHG